MFAKAYVTFVVLGSHSFVCYFWWYVIVSFCFLISQVLCLLFILVQGSCGFVDIVEQFLVFLFFRYTIKGATFLQVLVCFCTRFWQFCAYCIVISYVFGYTIKGIAFFQVFMCPCVSFWSFCAYCVIISHVLGYTTKVLHFFQMFVNLFLCGALLVLCILHSNLLCFLIHHGGYIYLFQCWVLVVL